MKIQESLLNKYVVYKIIKIMLTKWEKTDAYKLGILDKDGERTDKEIKTKDEKESYDLFHRFVYRVKRLFEKFLGKSKLGALFSMAVIFREMEEKDDVDLEQLDESEYVKVYKFIEEKVGDPE